MRIVSTVIAIGCAFMAVSCAKETVDDVVLVCVAGPDMPDPLDNGVGYFRAELVFSQSGQSVRWRDDFYPAKISTHTIEFTKSDGLTYSLDRISGNLRFYGAENLFGIETTYQGEIFWVCDKSNARF